MEFVLEIGTHIQTGTTYSNDQYMLTITDIKVNNCWMPIIYYNWLNIETRERGKGCNTLNNLRKMRKNLDKRTRA